MFSFTLPSWLNTSAVQNALSEIESLGKSLLTAAYNYGQTLAAHIETGFENGIPTVETALVDKLIDFVPSAERPIVQQYLSAIAAGTETQLNAELIQKVKEALATALVRLKSALGA